MEYISKKICYLAESLLVKGEFLTSRRFMIPPLSIADVQITPFCNRQSDRIVVEKIIASSIVDSYPGEDASTIYLVEVLAAVSKVSPPYQHDSIFEDSELTIVTSDSCHSYEQPITFTICHNSDQSFILFEVMF